MATTGKAATIIGGSTIFNKRSGLAIPIGNTFRKLPCGQDLRRLQRIYGDLEVLFVDECSMLHQKHLYFMDQRLRQIMSNNLVFGGVIVVLIGDTGQLPTVLGRVMWEQNPKTDNDIYGLNLYEQFQTVITLTENVRIQHDDEEAVFYDQFLIRLRDGKCTEDDYNHVRMRCSDHSLTDTEWKDRGFCGDNVTSLFSTNQEVNIENKKRILRLSKPIVRIEATNNPLEARTVPTDKFYGLKNLLFLAIGAKVVLEYNLCPEIGLANGCTGILKEIVYGNEVQIKPPSLPKYCWVEIEEYRGCSFFPPENQARKKWVPIYPITTEDFTKNPPFSRTMLPLRLTLAWTIWKAQGQTILNLLILHLRQRERDHGVSYTAFSRATKLSNIGIAGGFPGTRTTNMISRMKKIKLRLEEDKRLDDFGEQTILDLNSIREALLSLSLSY